MSRRSTKQIGIEIVLVIIAGIFISLVPFWKFLVETKLIWLIPFIIGGIVFFRWYQKRKNEEKRVEEIMAHSKDWGEEMCGWLIENRINLTDPRIERIMSQFNSLSTKTCQNLIQRKISIGMKAELVQLSLGAPTIIDNEEVTANSEKFRWVFGIPRKGATYIWFKNGEVSKIKQ
jgi:hypothetical protein